MSLRGNCSIKRALMHVIGEDDSGRCCYVRPRYGSLLWLVVVGGCCGWLLWVVVVSGCCRWLL